MLRIGITGGIGVGKSMICKVFSSLGVPTYNADLRTRWLQNHNTELIEKTKVLLGEKSYDSLGNLDRNHVASLVFTNPDLLKKYNQMIHPVVFVDFQNWCIENMNDRYIIKESALMFETGFYKQLDATILVTCPIEIRMIRTLKRDKQRTKADVEAIISKQMSEVKKASLSNFTLHNDGKHLILPLILELHKNFLAGNLDFILPPVPSMPTNKDI
jgi:dephospho-CoA kinase